MKNVAYLGILNYVKNLNLTVYIRVLTELFIENLDKAIHNHCFKNKNFQWYRDEDKIFYEPNRPS